MGPGSHQVAPWTDKLVLEAPEGTKKGSNRMEKELIFGSLIWALSMKTIPLSAAVLFCIHWFCSGFTEAVLGNLGLTRPLQARAGFFM